MWVLSRTLINCYAYIVGNLKYNCRIFHIADLAVYTTCGDNTVAYIKAFAEFFYLFLLFLLRTYHEKVKYIFRRIYDALSSARGKEVLLFMLFLLISYVFWLLLTLNNEVQEDMDVPVELVDVPDSVTIITDVPQVIKVSVRDKGSSLMKYRPLIILPNDG